MKVVKGKVHTQTVGHGTMMMMVCDDDDDDFGCPNQSNSIHLSS